jgi:hypothetical protein
MFTLSGYVVALISLIVFPGAALLKCYKETDREKEPVKAVSVFDTHLVAQSQSQRK